GHNDLNLSSKSDPSAIASNSLKSAFLAAAVLLLVATSEARGWAPEDGDQASNMVSVRTPAEQEIPGGAGTMAQSICLDCCCPMSTPNCQQRMCCATVTCNGGKCVTKKDCNCRCS
ncbi:unnamed protein product, partial [Urochloa humidicola]